MGKSKSKSNGKTAKSPKLTNDHDAFLRGLLSLLAFVVKKLNYVLSDVQLKYADLTTLRTVSGVFADGKMRYYESDGIFECDLRASALPDGYSHLDLSKMRFCFLMEGKSSNPNEPIDFQLDDYRKSIWLNDLRNDRLMGIVIPILIYNGKHAWNKKRIYDHFRNRLPPDLLEEIPNLRLRLIDLHALSDQDIINNIDLGALRGAFLAMKHAHDPEYFKRETYNLFKFAVEAEELAPKEMLSQYLQLLTTYIQRRSNMSETEVINLALNSNDENMVTKVKTVFDIAEERGLEKGLKQGIEQGIAIAEAKNEEKIKLVEAKFKEVEAKAEAKFKEVEAKAEAKFKEVEAKAQKSEAKLRSIIKKLMKTTSFTDAELVAQFDLSEDFVRKLRETLDKK